MIAREEYGPMVRAFGLAICVHILVALLMVLGTINWKPFRKLEPVGVAIEAVIVDTGEIRELQAKAAKEAAEALERKQKQERREKELEQQKQREKEAEIQKQKDIAAEKKKAQEDARRKKEAQDKLAALRLEKERKEKAEQEKQQKELEKVRQEAAEAEKKRLADAEKVKQTEARKKAEAAEQQRKKEEAEKQKKAADDAAAAAAQKGRVPEKSDKYTAAVRALVTQNWLRPPTAKAGLRCTLKIAQIPGGEVISAAISGSCNGDEATRRSIIDAIERASPLPYRGFEDVFEREIDFIFIYDGD